MINVTKTFLPPLEEYIEELRPAWESSWLTNNGRLLQKLEIEIKNYLNISSCLYASNGTIVLQLALKALDLKGEVITTPFSYVATTNAILWENLTPVFADIDPKTLCINPAEIERKISHRTAAILATHVYGNACDIETIDAIAHRYKIPVIYDGAHAFAAKLFGQSLLSFGNLSTCSFHATKLFHTVEGGSIHSNDSKLNEKLFLMRQFGHLGDDYVLPGINAKNSELHAAMGLCMLRYVDQIIAWRRELTNLYDQHLAKASIQRPQLHPSLTPNFSYYPIILENSEALLRVVDALEAVGIRPRRYFYPSLNTLKFVEYQSCPISESIAERVLCLPMSHEVDRTAVETITSTILRVR